METTQIINYLKTQNYTDLREIPNRQICGIERMIYTWDIWYGMDEYSREGHYSFPTYADAVNALNNWNGEDDPGGNWIKHKGPKGEYNNPNKN